MVCQGVLSPIERRNFFPIVGGVYGDCYEPNSYLALLLTSNPWANGGYQPDSIYPP